MADANDKPAQQEMGDLIEPSFGPHSSLLVKQTMRGCIQECFGCEAKSEFKIATLDPTQVNGYMLSDAALAAPDIMYAIEESSFCMRLCCRDGRSFDMWVSQGGEPGGQRIVKYSKPLGFPLQFQMGDTTCPCCCLLPKLEAQTPSGAPIGNESKYICDINVYVPKLMYSEGGQPVYIIKPQTCCGGCCIKPSCGGKGCLFVPFFFHDPTTGKAIGDYADDAPQIRKVWAGFKKECCSTADTFTLQFPPGIDAKRKAGLLGMTFLIDFTVFEKQNEKN
mmetsp:Transcript_85085/g.150455  ORF Transcript_85085/g.150455 Transcript_85085/m.150455 type:complete len:278 (+) Transcript_85085:69-902(+)|eukprot:CAMPEP_0197647494 /NCGR_PEP_ID=MMETSP1338-20131121/25558_1 /TAXON_ID=43686 ORGANISM="Pelagodinium beii, Strain RCC1491" /NCGR_SAMPLE_ID=MMETSP1338 /ASSEMBLY_ACC=CAM_ASM_000754 /LENGTH=277 /DNA_ID=CAMNT_0043221307 /DNA_START=69 /DNA_END=902 /DNA_ORIENTATION=+